MTHSLMMAKDYSVWKHAIRYVVLDILCLCQPMCDQGKDRHYTVIPARDLHPPASRICGRGRGVFLEHSWILAKIAGELANWLADEKISRFFSIFLANNNNGWPKITQSDGIQRWTCRKSPNWWKSPIHRKPKTLQIGTLWVSFAKTRLRMVWSMNPDTWRPV